MDKSCWLCGTRLYPGQLVADGGNACTDVRWYCLDMRGCTERWTARLSDRADLREGSTQTPQALGGLAPAEAAWPAHV